MDRNRKGFTLIELMVAVGIIAILSLVTFLIINPAQLLAQGRDSTRLSNMTSLNSALTLFTQTEKGAFIGTSSVVYVSIPDPSATSSAGDQCQGLSLPTLPSALQWTYQCASSSTVKNVNGTGWIPVNFTIIGGGSPLATLPVDPTNTSSTRLYYTYTTDGVSNYELTATMEASKNKLGGSSDVVSTDGGANASLYESGGTNFSLEPLDYGDSSLIGYWLINNASGTYDFSGNNNPLIPYDGGWASGVGLGGGYGLQGICTGEDYSGISGSNPPNYFPTAGFTVSTWVNSTNTSTPQARIIGFYNTSGTASYPYWWLNFGNGYPFVTANDINGNGGGLNNPMIPSSSAVNAADGNWHQIATTFSASGGVIYIDGTAVSSATFSAPFNGTFNFNLNDYIGVEGQTVASTSFCFANSTVNNIRIYNRILSAAEIQALYKARN